MITSAKKRILSAGLAVLMLVLTLTACGKNTEDYELYKTNIVGMWCDPDGPEYVPAGDGVTEHYKMYEFTSSGQLIYHTPTELIGSVYTESRYELRDNFLTVDEAVCKVKVDENHLYMTTNNGTSEYRRMSLEEVCNFGVVYIDSDNYEKQIDYTNFFSKNFFGKPYDNEEGTEETQAETTAAE